MIAFVDTNNELSFQSKFGIPDKCYGNQAALKNKPLDFQYESSELVSSFLAIQLDGLGNVLDSINLSTSLITVSGGYHICDGLTAYSSNLDAGIYYFLVNSHYQSEYFVVVDDLIEGSLGYTDINISGLGFTDNTIELSWQEKEGSPDYLYGLEYAEDSTPLPFNYLASSSITSFKAINYQTLEETTLSNSFITADGTSHLCDGLTNYTTDLDCGVYYFVVNGRYESELFGVLELENASNWILTTGIWNDTGIWIDTELWID